MIPMTATASAVATAAPPRNSGEPDQGDNRDFEQLLQDEDDDDLDDPADLVTNPAMVIANPAPLAQTTRQAPGDLLAADATAKPIAVTVPVEPAGGTVPLPPDIDSSIRADPAAISAPAGVPNLPMALPGMAESALRGSLEPDFHGNDVNETAMPDGSATLVLMPAPQAAPAPLLAAPPSLHQQNAPAATPPHQAAAAAQVAAQILPHARTDDQEVEVLLAPEELGKLRFSILQDGDRVKIALSAERPETLQILRRHADQLTAEFRAAGFVQTSIDFGLWSQNGSGRHASRETGQGASDHPDPASPSLIVDPPHPIALAAASSGQGLNLRL